MFFFVSFLSFALYQGCQPPTSSIIRIGREGMIDDVIMHGTWRHLYKKILVDSDCPKFAMTVTKCVKKMLLAL